MVLQSQKTGCVWKTPFCKSGHISRNELVGSLVVAGSACDQANFTYMEHPQNQMVLDDIPTCSIGMKGLH